jgi:nitroreductase
METEKAIMGRRSVREFIDRPIPEEVISQILKAGAMAPSAMDAQPCRYIVIEDKKRIKELSDKVKARAGVIGVGARFAERMKLREDVIFHSAPLLILIIADKGDWSEIDSALAAQNMMLRSYDLGLGSCFIGFANMLRSDRATLKSIGFTDQQELYCALVFGYPKEEKKQKNREAKIQDWIK